jgi:hypothetical protein
MNAAVLLGCGANIISGPRRHITHIYIYTHMHPLTCTYTYEFRRPTSGLGAKKSAIAMAFAAGDKKGGKRARNQEEDFDDDLMDEAPSAKKSAPKKKRKTDKFENEAFDPIEVGLPQAFV